MKEPVKDSAFLAKIVINTSIQTLKNQNDQNEMRKYSFILVIFCKLCLLKYE